MAELLQRIPPHNIEAEQSVLGSMLIDAESVSEASGSLKGEDFYSDAHKEIFEAMLDIYERGEPVDLVTLTEELRQRGTLEGVGGVSYISDLSMTVPSTANVKYYIQIVEEKSILRQLIAASNDIINESYEASDELDMILDRAEKRIFDISQRQNTNYFMPIKDVLIDTYARIE